MVETKNTSEQFAVEVRKSVLRMVTEAKASHVASCLSVVDILAVLYSGWLRIDPREPNWPERDRLILSKGHAAAALYATLAQAGFFEKHELLRYCQNGGALYGHVTNTSAVGIEISTGSLGHGLAVGIGMALDAKKLGKDRRTVVILSDGEMDEGSNWEGLLFAPAHKLDRLTVILDYNKIQSFGRTEEVLSLEPLADKLKSFNWEVREVDGHDHKQLGETLNSLPFLANKPNFIIAHTVKGKGVSFMEDDLLWHYRNPSNEQLQQALKELDA